MRNLPKFEEANLPGLSNAANSYEITMVLSLETGRSSIFPIPKGGRGNSGFCVRRDGRAKAHTSSDAVTIVQWEKVVVVKRGSGTLSGLGLF